jgi:hypothetical protein
MNAAAELNCCSPAGIDQQATVHVFGRGAGSLLQPVFHWLKEFKQILQ